MSEALAILVFAALFAVFGLIQRGASASAGCAACDGSCGGVCNEEAAPRGLSESPVDENQDEALEGMTNE